MLLRSFSRAQSKFQFATSRHFLRNHAPPHSSLGISFRFVRPLGALGVNKMSDNAADVKPASAEGGDGAAPLDPVAAAAKAAEKKARREAEKKAKEDERLAKQAAKEAKEAELKAKKEAAAAAGAGLASADEIDPAK